MNRQVFLAATLILLPVMALAQTPPFKPLYGQNPPSLYVEKPGLALDDGSVLYLQGRRSIRYWPASGKISEEPLPVEIPHSSAVQKISVGLVAAGGADTDGQGFDVGRKTVLLIRPGGDVLSAELDVARFSARSVVLADDSVLVVGGTIRYAHHRSGVDNDSARTTAAELISYRGGKLQVARVPDLPGEPRRGFQMVALQDGRVMVMGGEPGWYDSCFGCLADIWLFDPKSRQWQAGPPMKVPRVAFSATRLADGRVLIAGGWSPRSSDADDRVEVFDPRIGRWEDFPSLPAPLCGHRAVWLAGEEGKTLLFGGGTNPQIQALDVAEKRWSTVGEMRAYRIGAELLSYRDAAGQPWALLFGGVNFPRGQNPQDDGTVERIALRSRQIEAGKVGVFPLRRFAVALASAADGKTLLAGGAVDADPGSGGVSTASVDWLAPDQAVPVALPTLNHARARASAFWLPKGEAVVMGGEVISYNRRDTVNLPAEWYDPQAKRWVDLPLADDGKLLPQAGAAYGQFQDGSLLEVAGNAVQRLNIADGKVRRGALSALIYGHSGNFIARALPDGRIVVAGGNVQVESIAVIPEDPHGKLAAGADVYRGFGPALPSRRHEIFDPATGEWHSSGPARLAGEQAAILDDGRVVKLSELEPALFKGETLIPAKLLFEISNPDGSGWQELPLPEQMRTNLRETRLITQAGQLFLQGKKDAKATVMLWWLDVDHGAWAKLSEWDDSSFDAGKLVTVTLPNGKRLAWVWP